jgi:hypothetical protein
MLAEATSVMPNCSCQLFLGERENYSDYESLQEAPQDAES